MKMLEDKTFNIIENREKLDELNLYLISFLIEKKTDQRLFIAENPLNREDWKESLDDLKGKICEDLSDPAQIKMDKYFEKLKEVGESLIIDETQLDSFELEQNLRDIRPTTLQKIQTLEGILKIDFDSEPLIEDLIQTYRSFYNNDVVPDEIIDELVFYARHPITLQEKMSFKRQQGAGEEKPEYGESYTGIVGEVGK